jgi:hypothetical protein
VTPVREVLVAVAREQARTPTSRPAGVHVDGDRVAEGDVRRRTAPEAHHATGVPEQPPRHARRRRASAIPRLATWSSTSAGRTYAAATSWSLRRHRLAPMSLHLFAGLRVGNFDAAQRWYQRLLGDPTFCPHDSEAVWRLAEERSVYVMEHADGAGNSGGDRPTVIGPHERALERERHYPSSRTTTGISRSALAWNSS